jgi:branched-chain amino acid transport system permease protein
MSETTTSHTDTGEITPRTATVFTNPPSAKPPLWVTPIRAVWPLLMSLVVAIVIFHFVVPRIDDYQQVRISNCGIYIILAVSLTVVNGFTGQFSIGHSGFMAVGGYAAASLMFYGTYHCYGNTDFHGGFLSLSGLHPKSPPSFITCGDWLFVGSLLFGAIVAAAVGWVVGLPSLRLRGDYLAIVTLGFCEIVRVIIQSTPDQLTPKPTDPDDIDPGQMYLGGQSIFHELHHVGGALGLSGTPTYATIFWITLAALVTLALTIRLKYSGYGRAMLSIREDDIAAQAVGVNITRIKVRAFVFSAFFAGLAGGLSAMKPPAGTISAGDLGFQKSFEIVIMVVIGGLGSISGAAIAAVLLTLLPEWLRDIPPGPWGLYAAGVLTLAIPRIIRGRIGICFAIIFSVYASYHYKNLIEIVPSDYRMDI